MLKYSSEGILHDDEEFLRVMSKWRMLPPHPNIVQLLYVEKMNDIPRLYLEYVPSLSIEDLINTTAFFIKNDPKEIALKIYKIGFSVGRALRWAHLHRLYHLNLKPSNIFQINYNVNFEEPYDLDNQFCITDFGNLFLTHLLSRQQAFDCKALDSMILFW